jgi:hypothetical protein
MFRRFRNDSVPGDLLKRAAVAGNTGEPVAKKFLAAKADHVARSWPRLLGTKRRDGSIRAARRLTPANQIGHWPVI